MTPSIRLSKHLAEQLSCSRREAENYIEGGWVSVDGKVVEEPGFRVAAHQDVRLVEGARADDHKPATFLLHKRAGDDLALEGAAVQWGELIGEDHRAAEDRSGRRLLRRDLKGLQLLTPLEPEASGLVVLTQHPGIARRLTEDYVKLEQEYVVEVSGDIAPDGMDRLSRTADAAIPMKVSWQNETHLRFALKKASAHLITDRCRQVGLTVIGMKRIRIGRRPLAGLQPGQWRYLLDYERF